MKLGNWKNMLQAPAGDGDGGGGGDADAAKAKAEADSKAKADADAKELAELREFKSKHAPTDPDLKKKADDLARERASKEGDAKAIEKAVVFNHSKDEFLKANAALLPKGAADIFAVAEKERWDSPVEKASEIKAGLIHSFFSVQDNLDLLTPSQKDAVADYLKLTKNGRQENAQSIYSSVFEPTLEMAKRLRKAADVHRSKNGLGDGSDEAHKQKLIQGSRGHYIGEKK